MLVFIVLLSSILVIESLIEWFLEETNAGRSICRTFREAMRRNNNPRDRTNMEDDDE